MQNICNKFKGISLILYKDARVDQRILMKHSGHLAGKEVIKVLTVICIVPLK